MEDRGGAGEEEMVVAVDLVIYFSKTLPLKNMINVHFLLAKKALWGACVCSVCNCVHLCGYTSVQIHMCVMGKPEVGTGCLLGSLYFIYPGKLPVCSGNLNAGPHTQKASLSTEVYAQPLSMF